MSKSIFLKIDNVPGESKTSGYAECIDIDDWIWEASNDTDIHQGGGPGAGKVSVSGIVLTKSIDKATPLLWVHLCTGEHFSEATLSLCKPSGDKLEYYTITMNDGVISKMETIKDNQDILKERVTLAFKKFKLSYTEQKDDNTTEAPIEAGYNIATEEIV